MNIGEHVAEKGALRAPRGFSKSYSTALVNEGLEEAFKVVGGIAEIAGVSFYLCKSVPAGSPGSSVPANRAGASRITNMAFGLCKPPF